MPVGVLDQSPARNAAVRALVGTVVVFCGAPVSTEGATRPSQYSTRLGWASQRSNGVDPSTWDSWATVMDQLSLGLSNSS